MKNTYFFPHDYHARHDPKLEKIYLKYGYEGWGIYWALIEMLYEQGGYLLLEDIPLYAKGDDSLCERIANAVRGFGLFENDGVRFWSNSCLLRLQNIVEKSQKASLNAKKRWNNANAMPTQCDGNAIIREEKKEEEKSAFPFKDFWDKYPRQVGAGMAALTFKATIKTETDFKDLMVALNNYKASDEVKAGKIMNGDRWLEDWRGWVKVKPKMRIPC